MKIAIGFVLGAVVAAAVLYFYGRSLGAAIALGASSSAPNASAPNAPPEQSTFNRPARAEILYPPRPVNVASDVAIESMSVG